MHPILRAGVFSGLAVSCCFPENISSRDNSALKRCFSPFGGCLSFLIFEGVSMLWTIFAILIILWLLGWGFHVAGGLIHLLLVIALVVAVINLVTGRRTV
jgi:hypothetical protein